MGRWPAALALALAACGDARPAVPATVSKPQRVMSMNQCTDQLVLALLPPGRIASVSALARDPAGSLMVEEARRVAVNRGQAEEVVAQRPDLVVTGTYTTPATRALLRRLGYPMIEIPPSDSIDAIRAVTRQVARAVGEPARGEALIARMDRQFAALAHAPGPALRVAAWDGAGFSARPETLFDVVLRAAGAVNVANRPPASGYGRPDIEVLLQAAPTLLVRGGVPDRTAGSRSDLDRHPLVRRYWHGTRSLVVRPAYYVCGTPMVGDAAMRLRTDLRAAAAVQARPPLPFAGRGVP